MGVEGFLHRGSKGIKNKCPEGEQSWLRTEVEVVVRQGGKFWSQRAWRGLKEVWMWCWGLWFRSSAGIVSSGRAAGLDNLKGLFQPL